MNAKSICLLALSAIVCFAGDVVAQTAPQNFAGIPQPMGYGYPPVPTMGIMPTSTLMPVPGVMQAGATQPANCAAGCCDTGGCQGRGCTGCGNCCTMGCCDPCGWSHRVFVYGEYLYLRSRDSEVTYAVESNVNAPTQPPVQRGRMGVVDQDFSSGFRFGTGFTIDDCTSLGVRYTMFETESLDQVTRQNPSFGIQSLLLHPGTVNTGEQGDGAWADHSISFDLIDLEARRLFCHGRCYQISGTFGARYANLEQNFEHQVTNSNTNNSVATDIDFEGAGLRLGLDMRGCCNLKNKLFLTAYCNTHVNLLAGEFNGTYIQGNQFDNSQVDTVWEAGRIVPMYELEVGVGLCSPCGTWSVTCGYLYNAWANVVKTDDFIYAVHSSAFADVSDTITFDGLVGRIEARF